MGICARNSGFRVRFKQKEKYGEDMSGGFFNYENYRLGDLARTLEEVVSHNDDNEHYCYSSKTVNVMQMTVYHLKLCDVLLHRIDYLLSGDDDEASFQKNLLKQLDELEAVESAKQNLPKV